MRSIQFTSVLFGLDLHMSPRSSLRATRFRPYRNKSMPLRHFLAHSSTLSGQSSTGDSVEYIPPSFYIYYNDVYQVDLPPRHRFPMEKYAMVRKMVQSTLQADPCWNDSSILDCGTFLWYYWKIGSIRVVLRFNQVTFINLSLSHEHYSFFLICG